MEKEKTKILTDAEKKLDLLQIEPFFTDFSDKIVNSKN